MSKIEELERLARLADQGRITEQEYRLLKEELVSSKDQQATSAGEPTSTEETTAAEGSKAQPPGWYPSEKSGTERYWDGSKWTGAGRLVAPSVEGHKPGLDTYLGMYLDMYEVALAEASEPDDVGWFPDPHQLGTHMRFFDGDDWTDSTKERKAPGWYLYVERSKFGKAPTKPRERYFDGLEFTNRYRDATRRSQPRASRPTVQRPKDWRFWVGLILTALGGLGVLGALYRFSNEPIQSLTILMFNFVLDPLIWGGLFGLLLLHRWKEATDPPPGNVPPPSYYPDLLK